VSATHPCRLGITLVIEPQVADAGMPATTVGLEDETNVGIGRIDASVDPRQAPLTRPRHLGGTYRDATNRRQAVDREVDEIAQSARPDASGKIDDGACRDRAL
jgi:hypothetical protein